MKYRFIWLTFGGLIVAFLLFFIVQISGLTRAGQLPVFGGDSLDETTAISPDKIGRQPASFQNISEFASDAGRKMRLSGKADPGSVVVLLNRGERLRQIKTNADGDWGVTLDIDGQAMAIEALMFTGEGEVNIRSDETIFRIPIPSGPTIAAANYTAPALVIICSSGGPSRVIQSPFGQSPTTGPLSLGAIDYDDAGGVIFSGSASAEGRVRLYLGEAAIGETGVQADGRWNFTAGNMLPLGEYDVWAELIRPDEDRVRLGVLFERLPASPQIDSDNGSLSVKFEPLRWQVRRSLIGGGLQSTVIFAPQGQIEPRPVAQDNVTVKDGKKEDGAKP